MLLIRYCVSLILLCLTTMAFADDDDTRFLMDNTQRFLNKWTSWQHYRQSKDLIINVDGQDYRVAETLIELELAIYYAINQQQWDKVALFTEKYAQLEQHQEKIIAMAKGLMARAQGHYTQAIQHLETAQKLDNQDARIQLELGRILFEDKQYTESEAYFNQALNNNTLPDGTEHMIQPFIQAIEAKQGWHGSIALGVGYNNNINQQNGEAFCHFGGGKDCAVPHIKTPDPISSRLLNYEIALNKKIALKNNHNIIIKPITYGTVYHKKNIASTNLRNFTDNNSMLYAGYNYASIRSELNITPFMEYFYRNEHTNYTTQGMQIDGSYDVMPQWQIGGQISAKRYHYKEREKILNRDYSQYNAGINTSYSLANNLQVYGGLDYVRRKHSNDVASSHEYGIRTGMFKLFESSGLYINALALFRFSHYDAYDGFLQAKRKDRQQVYLASLGASKWSFKGIYPELRLKRVVNHSNISPVQFKQNEVALSLRKNF